MRTKNCFLIGRARCVDVKFIRLEFGGLRAITIDRHAAPDRDEFARSDGFANFDEMRTFWCEQHPEVFTDNGMLGIFEGVLILWEPLS
jgi:hypothetical protein